MDLDCAPLTFPQLALIVGAAWSLWVFLRNNRVNTAELLLQIETQYSQLLPALLDYEFTDRYLSKLLPALQKQTARPPKPLNEEELARLEALDRLLRFFVVCARIRRLRVDAGYIDRLNAWYLIVLTNPNRPELVEYVRRFWPTVYFWSLEAGQPWPKRLLTRLATLPTRIAMWWRGAPNRGGAPLHGAAGRVSPASVSTAAP